MTRLSFEWQEAETTKNDVVGVGLLSHKAAVGGWALDRLEIELI